MLCLSNSFFSLLLHHDLLLNGHLSGESFLLSFLFFFLSFNGKLKSSLDSLLMHELLSSLLLLHVFFHLLENGLSFEFLLSSQGNLSFHFFCFFSLSLLVGQLKSLKNLFLGNLNIVLRNCLWWSSNYGLLNWLFDNGNWSRWLLHNDSNIDVSIASTHVSCVRLGYGLNDFLYIFSSRNCGILMVNQSISNLILNFLRNIGSSVGLNCYCLWLGHVFNSGFVRCDILDGICSFVECNFTGLVGVSLILLNGSGHVGRGIGDNSLVHADIFRNKGSVGADVLGSINS